VEKSAFMDQLSFICYQPQAFPTATLRDKLEAANHIMSVLMGGSLIPIVVYRDGAGFF
jgi:hypothetical protein